MKVKQLLIALLLAVFLTTPAVPAAQPASPALEPSAVALARPAAMPAPHPATALQESPEDGAIPEALASVPGVTEDWWQKVQAAIIDEIYAFTAEQSDGGPAYRGSNPGQGFDIALAAGSLRLARSTAATAEADEKEPGWIWELRTTGLGVEDGVRSVSSAAETAAKGNRLGLERAGLTEWYVNDERGLEQGFTVDAPPDGGGEFLVVEMALDTDLVPIVTGASPDGGGQDIDFTRPGGNVVVLRYGNLAAYDAAGRPLPAHVELSRCGQARRAGRCDLRLVVEAGGAAYPLTIDPVIAVPSWTALGENAGNHFGFSVAPAGDVNGDTYDDVVVSAPTWSSSTGKVYLYHGSASGLGAGAAWWATGEGSEDLFGWSVATAGDVNGDDFDDLVVGAPGRNNWQGAVYVYYGSAAGLGAGNRAPDWWAAGESSGDHYGHSVAPAGHVNNDSFDDVIVSAPYRADWRGKVYLYHGAAGGLGSNNRAADWTTAGEDPDRHLGWCVATAGNVNGDGYDDVIVGVSGWTGWQGAAHVYYGSAAGLGASNRAPDWTAVGTGGVQDGFGVSVATAGDVNGDGYDDVIVGAPSALSTRGAAYIYHGSVGGLGEDNRSPDWTATGENDGDRLGWSAATAGDLNGDGYADVVVGAWGYSADLYEGKAYVYHGSAEGVALTAAWTAATTCGGGDFSCAAATAGDVNGDGYADLILGERRYDSWRGRASVYHGTPWGLNPASDWAAGGEQADDQFGYAVSTAGDVNGDGFSDLLVGAPGHDGGRGRAYLFPGTPAGLSAVPVWIATGENTGDRFAASLAAAGDVNGDGYDDVVAGAAQNDDNGTNAGKAYLFYGSAAGPADGPGWTATGANQGDRFGVRVAAAGDVNGDGLADLAAGADGYPQGAGYGKAYVYHGSVAGLASSPAWTASGTQSGARFGWAAGTAGDVNGDGCADLVVGAWAANGYAGAAYVYHGCSPVGLSIAPNWSQGGETAGSYYGYSVATAGDVNGDGYADVVAGAYGLDGNKGKVYLYHGSATGLSGLSWSAGGATSGDNLGCSVATAGDANGDGYADLVAGAEGYWLGSGLVRLYYGSPAGLGISDREPDWTASGAQPGDHLGAALGTAGDVNGDGFADLVAGAWGADDPAHPNAGRVYVYHRAAPSLGTALPLTLNGEGAFGYSVAAAGDVNGDGYTDLVVGAPGYDSSRGKVYVYHGSAAGPGDTPAWSATGESLGNEFGYSVAAAGDVNGDGYADLVVGAYRHDSNRGKAYVYHGSAAGLDDTPARTVRGENYADRLGTLVATAGDVNGDGYADILVVASWYSSGRGKVYLHHGSPAGLAVTPAWSATGEGTWNYFGHSAATAGDVNGDGYADVIVSAVLYDGYRGKVYVYHGSAAGLSSAAVWTASAGAYDRFGYSAATAGDVNGDGYADVAVGAITAAGFRGQVYVYQGSALGLDVPFSVFSGENQNDHLGAKVATAGDVNGDGFADLLVGSVDYPNWSSLGKVYLYHGSAAGLDATPAWTETGEGSGQGLGAALAAAGDVNGDGFGDVILGTPGDSGGRVDVYQANDGGGRPALARQVRGDASGQAVQPWGPSYTADSLGVRLRAVHPLGRGRARLQVQVCPPGVPFGHSLCREEVSANWIEVPGAGGVELKLTVSGLEEGGLVRWRARALYDSPLYSRGPWRRVTAQALEGDVRASRLPADLSIAKTMIPLEPVGSGEAITYTITFHSNGPARGVVITDFLSADITAVQITSSGAAIADTGHQPCCVWRVQDLEANEGGVITVTGLARADRYVNTVLIGGTSPDPNPANNTATVQTHVPGILYVDRDATGANNGLSWASAYTDLQAALGEVQAGDQVWIASGVYEPGSQRGATFALPGGVRVHGGFAGSERWLHERDGSAAPTVLSGDVGTANNPADNVYHVVTAGPGVTETAVLEGLTIAGGNADGVGANGLGGGLYSPGGSPTLLNVTLAGNAAEQGGGVYLQDSQSLLVNVALSGNRAGAQGGGLYTAGGSPLLANVTFSGNLAASGGGLYHTAGGAVTLTNAILWGNTQSNGTTPDQIAGDGGCSVSKGNIQGGCPSGATCDQVLDQDPQLWNAAGADGLAGTLDDDLRLYTTFRHPSPAIDAGDNGALPADIWDLDGDGDSAEPLPLDLSGRERLIGFTAITPAVDVGAYEATLVDVLAAGRALFEQGESFRLEHLQLLSADTLAQALQNYANLNDGEWYYAFCADYGRVDADGYCADTTPPRGIRNLLLDAVDLYRVGLAWPTEVFTPTHGLPIAAWQTGGQGVMAAATEIANVHLVFGNEFLVDATDYRFSTGGIPTADQIIAQELQELGQAQRQFELVVDLVFRALSEWGAGEYGGSDQFEQVGMASSLLMSTLNETAARHYMLRDSQAALEVYKRAYGEQYLHLMALADLAAGLGEEYLQRGTYEMLNNLSQMRERAQAIHDGLDFFGFAPTYAPLQSYEQLLYLTEVYGDTGLLGTARDLEDQAREAQRTFDANASDMATELDNLTVELNGQLFDLCGQSDDDYQTCEGGLMLQNLDALDAASIRAGLAWLQAQNLAEQVRIEEERADQVITVRLALGQDLSAAELAIGELRRRRTTTTSLYNSENQINLGVEAGIEGYFQMDYKFSPLPGLTDHWEGTVGFKAYAKALAAYNHAWSWIDTTATTTDENEYSIAVQESGKTMAQAITEADIEGANSAAVVRNLLLQQSEALREYEIAVAEFNALTDEHNNLGQRLSRLLNLRRQAIDRVANHNSHLLNPAYRIWRDSLTTQSAQALGLAAQFAYLTARAAEYELLTPYPNLGQIFRARTANDIRLFLDGLKVWTQALNLPGQLGRYPYTLSLARDVWGLTDESLQARYPDLPPEELPGKRFELFQELLQTSVYAGQLEVSFSTTLDQRRPGDRYLFSPNVWNNRIAGSGEPLAESEGVRLNIVTRQPEAVDGVEVVLIHGTAQGGAEAYRNVQNEIVYYDPDTAVPVGYVLPAGLAPENTTVVLRPGINGGGAIANGGLMNLSVSSTGWTMRIPASSRGNLRYEEIEDIEIVLDTTARALPGREAPAAQDAANLRAGLEIEPRDVEPARSAPASAPAVTPPAIAGAIGGPYAGMVMVTSPVTVALQVLDVNVWNAGGTLTGSIAADQAALYPANVGLHGAAAGDRFVLASEAFTNTVAGRTVTHTLALAGHIEAGGDILRAVYTGTIANLLPEPIVVHGQYHASRPSATGSERLVVESGDWTVGCGASTTITATLYSAAMERIAETRTITFTATLGSVTPAVVQTVNGQAAVTFTGGPAEGQALVLATTGEITGGVPIQISGLVPPLYQIYLPLLVYQSP